MTNAEAEYRQRRKYFCRNPVLRFFLNRFFHLLRSWLDEIQPQAVLDVGCGEGFFWQWLGQWGPLPKVTGIDIRPEALALARKNLPHFHFVEANLLDYSNTNAKYDLILASEVLEHLPEPEKYLRKMGEIPGDYHLLTVPHEPYFRLCNFFRGRDIFSLGNHPDHVNHWSKKSFLRFVTPFLTIEKLATPFPFLAVLGKAKKRI